jgi:hypothetical protein
MKKETIEKLAGLTAISTAMGTSANAAIVASTTIPTGGLVSPTSHGTSNWDIDNDGAVEFSFSLSVYDMYTYTSIFVFIGELGNTRVAGEDGATVNTFKKLSAGAKLGTASDALGFNTNNQLATVAFNYGGSDVSTGVSFQNGGWSVGDTGYFGFKFTKDGNTHYGWAEMTLSATSVQFTINEAWYNDTPDGAVTIGVGGAVPEPAEVGLGLGVLALGAAGLRRMRQRGK